ncbi:MAG: beta-propeller domain-containing protein [Acidimicrobiales bacterium]|nr:beta-propeller domain-containing protein [Acidimicrobiales bacterium]
MSELSDRLRRLSARGTERGASAVFAAAEAESQATGAPAVRNPHRWRTSSGVTAIAAAVLLIAGVAGAMVIDSETSPTVDQPAFAAGTTSTSQGATTTSQLPPAPSTPKIYLASTRLVAFDACPSLVRYAQQRALDTVGPYGLPDGGGGVARGTASSGVDGSVSGGQATADGASAPQSGSAPPAARTSAPTEFSGTNVQEVGIDEPDSVKTDGKTIFAISNNKVFATSTGATPAVVGSIDAPNSHELMLVGTKLIVIGNGNLYAADSRVAAPHQSESSKFSVYDVSNPSAMKFTGAFDVVGAYVSARLVDGVARIAVRSYPTLPFTYPTDGSAEAQAAAVAHNRDVIRQTTADSWLPHFTVTNAAGQTSKSKALATCNDSYRPPSFSGFGMLSVVTFNTDNPSDSHATSVMADGQIVYASAERMYVATNGWDNVENNTVEPSANTLVHAFDIRDKTDAAYLSSGKVRGTVLNQFSMSERDGLLRIATTDPSGGSQSFMTVLQNNGEAYVPIGQVGGLGHGERIYAVRFIDDAAYVVTFRQVDPLYVVDLSDPTKPTVKGELKITGYSAYLHPIGPGRLLGIGQEATTEGRRMGVQASIFDVSNPSAPRLVAKNVVGGNSATNAEYDHHAFLYWAPAKLAVIPLSIYDQQQQFNGAIGMRVNDASVDEVGRMQPPAPNGYSPGIERNIVIGDRLFAVSHAGVLVNTLDLKSTSWVPYPSP